MHRCVGGARCLERKRADAPNLVDVERRRLAAIVIFILVWISSCTVLSYPILSYPILSFPVRSAPFSAQVCLGDTAWQEVYPMDYYSNAAGVWGNYHEQQQKLAQQKAERVALKGR